MQILLSSIGSRGDVQPILALALELQALGQRTRLCVAPNFKEWIESYGLECVPIGPDLRKLTGGTVPGKPVLPPPDVLQRMAEESVRTQFDVLGKAASGCDVVVGAGALQVALRSVAEINRVPYIFAAYCPAVLPSPKYPPPKTGGCHPFDLPESENLRLWQENTDDFERFGPVLNEQRAKAGLDPVRRVQPYIFTDHPWLAADPVIAPAFPAEGLQVVQTGAWMLDDPAVLPDELEEFLATGTPPVFMGFGSMRASEQTARALVEAARRLGLRALLSQGWADLSTVDSGKDVLSVGEVDHARVFQRVAAVVHHGGAGTTHTAARAGAAQVIIPHNYDQFYWAERVQALGVGVAGPARDDLSVESLVQALQAALRPEVGTAARELSTRMELRGARIAAERLLDEFG